MARHANASAAAGWIARGVVTELIRGKDLYVLALLMGVFCVGALAVRAAGVTSPAVGTFLLNLGMTLAAVFAHILALILAVRQVPDEVEHRTIYPILARPVGRHVFLVGKWLAVSACGAAAYAIFLLMVFSTIPKLETYDAGLCIQTVVLLLLSLSLTASLAILLSLVTPKGVALLLLGGLLFFGGLLRGVVGSTTAGHAGADVVQWCMLYLPDFQKLNLTTRYTDGVAALGAGQFGGLMLHAIFFTACALLLSGAIFRRRPL